MKIKEDDTLLPDCATIASHQMTFHRNLVARNLSVESYAGEIFLRCSATFGRGSAGAMQQGHRASIVLQCRAEFGQLIR